MSSRRELNEGSFSWNGRGHFRARECRDAVVVTSWTNTVQFLPTGLAYSDSQCSRANPLDLPSTLPSCVDDMILPVCTSNYRVALEGIHDTPPDHISTGG